MACTPSLGRASSGTRRPFATQGKPVFAASRACGSRGARSGRKPHARRWSAWRRLPNRLRDRVLVGGVQRTDGVRRRTASAPGAPAPTLPRLAVHARAGHRGDTRATRSCRTILVDREPARRYARGRVVLLGDAAHPTTPNLGQGANMAIDDAIALARALRDEADVPRALARYERERLPRTRRIVKQSWDFGRHMHLGVRARGLDQRENCSV